MAEGRRQASLDGFWETLTAKQLRSIEAVAMDMWDPYVALTRAHLPESDQKIVYDKFHIAQHLAKAVDQVRRAENKQLRAAGDERLKGTKYQWLRHPASFTTEAWREFRALREADLKTARAWALKESLMRLFDYRYAGAARRFFEMWSQWASRCRLEPMIQVARIQWVKASARGFRNQQNFITAIYFYCGGLDLGPEIPTH